jgi:hypothetical protein
MNEILVRGMDGRQIDAYVNLKVSATVFTMMLGVCWRFHNEVHLMCPISFVRGNDTLIEGEIGTPPFRVMP